MKFKKIRKIKKANIPKAIREQVWIKNFKKKYENKCYIHWCDNIINVFDFHVGHNIPKSKGGTLNINNLKPICSRCNLSMSDNYTIDEWSNLCPIIQKKEIIEDNTLISRKNIIPYKLRNMGKYI